MNDLDQLFRGRIKVMCCRMERHELITAGIFAMTMQRLESRVLIQVFMINSSSCNSPMAIKILKVNQIKIYWFDILRCFCFVFVLSIITLFLGGFKLEIICLAERLRLRYNNSWLRLLQK